MQISQCSLVLWLAAATTTTIATAATAAATNNNNAGLVRRNLQATTATKELWGVQSGAANAHSDAGGMVYDHIRDEVSIQVSEPRKISLGVQTMVAKFLSHARVSRFESNFPRGAAADDWRVIGI